MKKLFSVIVVLLLVLVGCGTSSSKSDIVDLNWYMIGTPQTDTQMVMDELNIYLNEKIGVNLNMTYFDWGEYDDKMQVKINSGEEFDIAFTADWALTNYAKYAKQGMWLPLNEYFDNELKDTHAAVDQNFWEGVTIDDKIYGIPTQKEIAWEYYSVFDKEITDKYKLDWESVTSLEDAIPLLQKVKENEPDYIPVNIDANWQPQSQLPLDCLGALNNIVCLDYEKEGAVYESAYSDARTIDLVKTQNKLFTSGLALSENVNDVVDLSNNKWYFGHIAAFPLAEQTLEQTYLKELYLKQQRKPFIATSSTQGAVNVISATSKNPDKAAELLNLVNTDPYVRNMIAYGIEGTHYERDANKQINRLALGLSNYNTPAFAQGNFFALDLLVGEDANKWDVFKESNDNAFPSPALGFIPDLTAYDAELANIKNTWEKYKTKVALGYTETLDADLTAFEEELDAVGLQKVIDGINVQYKEWQATK